MDVILEGIDTGNAQLILEQSNEFQAAYDALNASVTDFMEVINAASPNLDGLKSAYVDIKKNLDIVKSKISSVGDDFSYEEQLKLLKKSTEEDTPPQALLTIAAMNHDTNINAVKDAIIAIATWLEGAGKGIFTVGAQGIQINSKFQACLSKELSLADFVKVKPENDKDQNLVWQLAGVEARIVQWTDGELSEPQKKGLKQAKEKWKGFYNPTQKTGEEEEKRWNEFVAMMYGLQTSAGDAWKSAGKAIQEGKPSPEFQKQVEGFGKGMKNFVGNLFKGKSEGKIDPVKIMGEKPDTEEPTLMNMKFDAFSQLVVKLLEMSQKATEVAEQAGEAVEAQEEATQPPEEFEAYKKKLADLFDDEDVNQNPEALTNKLLVDLQNILEGPPTAEKVGKILEKLPELLEKKGWEEQEIKFIMKKLKGDTGDSDDETSELDETLLDGAETEEQRQERIEAINPFRSNDGQPNSDNDPEEVEAALETLNLSPEQQAVLQDELAPEEQTATFEPKKYQKDKLKQAMHNKWGKGGNTFSSDEKDILKQAFASMGLALTESYDAGKKKVELIQDLIKAVKSLSAPKGGRGGSKKKKKSNQANKTQEFNKKRTALLKKLENPKYKDYIFAFVKDELEYQLAERTKHRWGVLAGIIKG